MGQEIFPRADLPQGFPVHFDPFRQFSLAPYIGDTASFFTSSQQLSASGTAFVKILLNGFKTSSPRVDVKLSYGDTAMWILLRWRDANNYLALRQDGANAYFQSTVNGVTSFFLTTANGLAANAVRWWRVVIINDVMKAWRFTTDPNVAQPPTPEITMAATALPAVWASNEGLCGLALAPSATSTPLFDDLRIGLA